MARDPEAIQRDIERARDQLGSTLDQLAERASPSNLVESGKQSVRAFFASTKGKIVVGAAGAVAALLVVRRVQLARRDHARKAELQAELQAEIQAEPVWLRLRG